MCEPSAEPARPWSLVPEGYQEAYLSNAEAKPEIECNSI